MPDEDTLERRLRAIERTLTDGDHEVTAIRDAGDRIDRIEALESRLTDVEDRLADLDAGTQALRGYVGNVRSVNEDVEQRADAALAAVERLEARVGDGDQQAAPARRRPPEREITDDLGAAGASRTRNRGDDTPPDEADGDSLVGRVRDALG
jgi:chromosome segregation ATPase